MSSDPQSKKREAARRELERMGTRSSNERPPPRIASRRADFDDLDGPQRGSQAQPRNTQANRAVQSGAAQPAARPPAVSKQAAEAASSRLRQPATPAAAAERRAEPPPKPVQRNTTTAVRATKQNLALPPHEEDFDDDDDFEDDPPTRVIPPAVRTGAALRDAQAWHADRTTYDDWFDDWNDRLRANPLVVAVGVSFLSLLIILLLWPDSRTVISRAVAVLSGEPVRQAAVPVPPAPPGEHSVLGEPTITAEQIEAILARYGSPAAGTGQIWINKGLEYNIDPAYAMAFFIHESTAGTHPNWAGHKPDGTTTHNVGNIICAGYRTCYGRFRDYPDWQTGIADWYRLIAVEYVEGRGTTTLEQIIPIYAPAFENDVPRYVNTVESLVNDWRRGVIR